MFAAQSFRLLAIPLLCMLFAFTASPLHAEQAKSCEAADLDVALSFAHYARSTYIVKALSTNISHQSCLLQSTALPEFFSPAGKTPLDVPIGFSSGSSQPITLAPGSSAHQMLRWSISTPSDGTACINASAMNLPVSDDSPHPVQIVSPSLLPPICSQVAFDSYSTGPTFGDDDSVEAESELSTSGSVNISSGIYAYHPGESFIVHAEATPSQDNPGFAHPSPCPSFFVRQRAADGSSRFEEFPRYRCGIVGSPNRPPVLTASFDAVRPIQPDLPGETSIQVFELFGRLTDARIRFVESNVIKLRITTTNQASETPTGTYDGWKTGFTLADTSFGKQSALLDQATHLEWLRLSATRNKNEQTLSRNMYPHKVLDGWRFATQDEVVVFFQHFTGAPNGRTTDPTIVHELQRLLGGPLAHTQNTSVGWQREYTRGRIAGYEAPTSNFGPASGPRFRIHFAYLQEENSAERGSTALADPGQIGWVDGDRNSPDTGYFLVRDHSQTQQAKSKP